MKLFAFLVVLVVLFPVPAYAYLDPATGSMILQIVVAAIAGAMVSLNIYWTKVSDWVKKKKSKPKD